MTEKITIAHVSDIHGQSWPEIPNECEFVVYSGDGLPNASRGKLEIEIPFQTKWVEDNIENYRKWLKGKTLLYCQGNHCFINPVPILNFHGIDAIDLTNKVVIHCGITFYGFPFIPYIENEWAHERRLPDMNNEIRYMLERIKDAGVVLDVLVAHCPPWGVLDFFAGNHWGNSLLSNMIVYNQIDPLPKYILCGHCHGSYGSCDFFGVEISQAATRVHTIDYLGSPSGGGGLTSAQ